MGPYEPHRSHNGMRGAPVYVDPVQVTTVALSAVDDYTGPAHEEALQQSGMNGGGAPGTLSLPTKLFATDRFGERRKSFVNPLLSHQSPLGSSNPTEIQTDLVKLIGPQNKAETHSSEEGTGSRGGKWRGGRSLRWEQRREDRE